MKEFKIGERVTITLEIAESNSCEDCFFNTIGDCFEIERSKCLAEERLDGKNISFIEVKE